MKHIQVFRKLKVPNSSAVKIKGFTLTEVIVVLAIIAIVAAIMFPVIMNAKKSAYKATTTSNLRQCITAALIYEGDNDDLPTAEAIFSTLAKVPTCDKMDYWRQSCSNEWGLPMVGSYGYVLGIEEFKDKEVWQAYKQSLPNYPVFAAIWYTDNKFTPFHGNSAPAGGCFGEDCFLPNKILYAMHDGSILNWHVKKYRAGKDPGELIGWAFAWSNIFNDELFL